MDQATHNRIVSFIWGIADDVLRDLFKRGKYPDVILPMCVLKGEGIGGNDSADHIVGGAEWSTLSHDAFPGQEFDFIVANPPYGKSEGLLDGLLVAKAEP